MLLIWIAAAAVAWTWLWRRWIRYHFYYLTPVAYPGGPLAQHLTRRAKWDDRETTLEPGWVFLHAEESHAYTGAEFPGAEMTGEPAGRQMWAKLGGSGAAADVVSSVAAAGTAAAAAAAPPPRRLSFLGGGGGGGGGKPAAAAVPPLTFNPARNPNASDKVLRAQNLAQWKGPRPDEGKVPANAAEAARKGAEFYQMIQCEDGHWAADYGGPMFLLPGMLIVYHVTGEPLAPAKRDAMAAYLRNHQQADGGWGTHIECASTMFGSVLSYVALRLLGAAADDPAVARGRAFIREHGGAVMTSSWAKFWLTLLGAHEWEGINSVPPELWMLPRWFPFHPGRLWCHCRMVYLPMSYLYGTRFRHGVETSAGNDGGNAKAVGGVSDPLVAALREELYVQPYAEVDWDAARHAVSPLDAYSPIHPVMRLLQNILALYEKHVLPRCPPLQGMRARGVRFAAEYMHEEDLQTNYVDIGPVNKALNWLSAWVEAGKRRDAPEVRKHVQRADDYLWVAEDGMKMQGYNGSQCWDTSFAIQAYTETGLAPDFPGCCRRAWRYLEKTQIAENEEKKERFFRHISKGGWPFSTAAHGWPISDCTSEGLKAVLALLKTSPEIAAESTSGELPKISDQRFFDAVEVILSLQNHDGGWATYENNRGFGWYEMLNPSEVFGDIMIDYSYVECSSASVTALKAFQARFPFHRAEEIKLATSRGARFVRSIQRPDGSWYGSWGVCFTYGTWFGIKALRAEGATVADASVARAVRFLLARQNANGGWGESYVACVDKAYPAAPSTASVDGADLGTDGSGIVQTGWAMLGLMASGACEELSSEVPELSSGNQEISGKNPEVSGKNPGISGKNMGISGKKEGPGKRERHPLLADVPPATVRAALDKGAAFLMSKQLPSGDWPQEGITGVFNRSTGITYTAYRNVFPIWALGMYSQLAPQAAT